MYRCSEIFGDNRFIRLDVLTMVTLEVTLFWDVTSYGFVNCHVSVKHPAFMIRGWAGCTSIEFLRIINKFLPGYTTSHALRYLSDSIYQWYINRGRTFVRWRPISVGPQYGTCFMSPIWSQEFGDGSRIFFENLCTPAIWYLRHVGTLVRD